MGKFSDSTNASAFKPFDDSQEPIFPPELKLRSQQFRSQSLMFKGEDMTWYRPRGLDELLDLKSLHPEAKLVVGNTELGVEMKFKHARYPVMIQSNEVINLSPYNLFVVLSLKCHF